MEIKKNSYAPINLKGAKIIDLFSPEYFKLIIDGTESFHSLLRAIKIENNPHLFEFDHWFDIDISSVNNMTKKERAAFYAPMIDKVLKLNKKEPFDYENIK